MHYKITMKPGFGRWVYIVTLYRDRHLWW